MRVMNPYRRLALLALSSALVAAPVAAQAPVPVREVPRDLSEISAKAGLPSPIAAWCGGKAGVGGPGAYAIAVQPPGGDGRYMILQRNGTIVDLAAFKGSPSLACYTPAEARKLNVTISRSETIEGRITPRWKTTVVCGFTDNTTAVCWQYSPVAAKFVTVGGWIT